MIGDRAYDSDPLDQRIQQRYGLQLIAPHKFVRVAIATQDGRCVRRYMIDENVYSKEGLRAGYKEVEGSFRFL